MSGEDCKLAAGVLIVVLVLGHSAMDADIIQSLLLIHPLSSSKQRLRFLDTSGDITSDTGDSAPT